MTDESFPNNLPDFNGKAHSENGINQPDPLISTSSQQVCPACHNNNLEIDGCLNLTCPACGYTQTGGGFT
jgi:hypothetical protein